MSAEFDRLDYATQVARLDAAAQSALGDYGLAGAATTRLTYTRNVVYHVQHGGSQYKLRLHRPGDHAAHIIAELDLLARLHAAGLCVPPPVPTITGALSAGVHVAGLADPMTAVLLGWIDGESRRAADLTPVDLNHVGRFLGRLHDHTRTLTADLDLPHLDWDGLFGDDSPYNPGDGARIFTAAHLAVFDAVAAHTRAVFERLGDDYGIIHADMLTKNYTLTPDGRVCPFDFDTASYGYYLYDLAPPLLEISAETAYAEGQAALWQGYTAERPQPPDRLPDLETLVAARHVASCRWIAGNLHQPRIRQQAPQIIETRVAELRGYLDTGRLLRRSQTF